MGKMNFVAVITCLCVLRGTSLTWAVPTTPSGCDPATSETKCLYEQKKGESAQPNKHNEAETIINSSLASPVSISVDTDLKKPNPPQETSGSAPVVSGKNSTQVSDSGGVPSIPAPVISPVKTGNDTPSKPTTPSTKPNTTTVPATTTSPETNTTTATTTTPATTPTPVPTSTTIPTEPSTTPSTTVSPTSPSPTTASSPPPPTKAPSTKSPPTSTPDSDRRFDGPSFIGGIVFALGVTAIGFVAWKFYKARTERNYHTL